MSYQSGNYGGESYGNQSQRVVVKKFDMSEEMQREAVDIAIEKGIATTIKKKFDSKFGTTWHCIVGRNFGSYVTHETKHFI